MNIPITPKKDLRNNWNEIMLEKGVTYHIVRYVTSDILIVRSGVGERAVPRSWLVECGALEPA